MHEETNPRPPAAASSPAQPAAPAGAPESREAAPTTRSRRMAEAAPTGYQENTWNGLPHFYCPRCTFGTTRTPDRVIARGEGCEVPDCPVRAALEVEG